MRRLQQEKHQHGVRLNDITGGNKYFCDSILTAGEAPCTPQRPNAAGGSGQTAGQREAEAPVCCPGQHHWTLDSN